MVLKRTFSLSNLTLLVALALSTVAAYYSIIGLTAIFAGAVIPIIIMGSILEVGKITTTVWLRKYWNRASLTIKLYLVPAVVLLAFLTSMGIFGFLSKAHTDQSLVSGDVLAKISVYDEKIKTSKENIDANRKALKQLDEAVDQVMGRSSDEKGAEKAVAIRKGQAKDRARLQSEIAMEQKAIAGYNAERAPIAAEVRKVEAEVGPIKYIAAFIYGDSPEDNLLEKAVRWVIILIVIVFDPLAIALVLAANASKEWDLEEEVEEEVEDIFEEGYKTPFPYAFTDVPIFEPIEEKVSSDPHPIGWMFTDLGEHPKDSVEYEENQEEIIEEKLPEVEVVDKLAYLKTPFTHFKNLKPMPAPHTSTVIINEEPKPIEEIVPEVEVIEPEVIVPQEPIKYLADSTTITTEGVTKENPLQDLNDGYVLYENKHYSKSALKEMKPELFMIRADDQAQSKTNFGTEFPKMSKKGDIFVRVDILPNRVYKFDSKKWIEINKISTDSYLYDQEYIKHLVSKISTGEYDIELLTESEKVQVEEYLKNQNS